MVSLEKMLQKIKRIKSIPEGEADWSFKLSNEAIREITKTTEIKNFCDMQHLKYIAHVMRCENSSLQKQFLFMRRLRVHQGNGKSFQN